jgi:uncharacterized protein DUF6484
MATHEEALFEPLARSDDGLVSLLPRARESRSRRKETALVTTPVTATFLEFNLEDRPVIQSRALLGGELIVARATVRLERGHLGRSVVVLCENGDPRLPIIVGVIEQRAPRALSEVPAGKRTDILADGERHVVEAEREIVLRCGESSITLTRAGKVIIKGRYILSRSSGHNKIKGAAVDIN